MFNPHLCHISCVICHILRVTCNIFSSYIFWQSGGASQGRVRYQRGLPCPDLQHHQQRKFFALTIQCFVVEWLFGPNFTIFFGKILMKSRTVVTWPMVAFLGVDLPRVFTQGTLKNVLSKYFWLNTSVFHHLNFDKIFALFGVNFVLLKSCWCQILDI